MMSSETADGSRAEIALEGLRRCAVPFLVLLAAAVGFYSLGHYDHNDHLNGVVPVMARNLHLYSDFAYDQTPLSVLIAAEIGRLVGDRDLYAVLRIYSLLLNLAVVLTGIVLCRREASDRVVAALMFAGLYLSFGPTVVIGGEIGNYTLALFLFSLSLLCFDVLQENVWGALLAGLFAGLAVSAKLSYAFMLPAYGIFYLMLDRAPKTGLVETFLFSLGAMIGLVPILFYAFSDYDAFVFENIHVHYLQNIYRGLDHVAGHANLLVFSIESAAVPIALTAIVGVTLFVLWRFNRRSRMAANARFRFGLTRMERALLCLSAAAVIGAITPSIVFAQYLAAPAFLVFLLAALFSDRLLNVLPRSDAARTRIRIAAICAVMILGFWQGAAAAEDAGARLEDGVYGVAAVSAMRDRLAAALTKIDRERPGCHSDLVSAFADFAVGSGVRISPVSATGPFIMRLDSVFAERAPAFRRFSDVSRYLSPKTLILSGFYNDASYEPVSAFQKVMEDYARDHDFAAIDLGSFMYRPVVLYEPKACSIALTASAPRGP